MPTATTRTERLQRITAAAAAHLSAIDAELLRRCAANLAAADAGELSIPEAAGVFSVNVDELLSLVERLARPAAGLARYDWDAEAAEREQYADVLAADEADQRRMDARP
jgi:hypothetical protein